MLSMFLEIRKYFVIFIIILSANTYAKEPLSDNKIKKWSFGAGLFYTSLSQRRGALLYDDPIAFPLFSIKYDDWLSLARGGVEIYKKYEWGKLSFSPSYFDDQIPFFEDEQEEFRKARVISIEAQFKAEINLRRKTKVSMMYAKEIKNHQGNFFEASIMTPLTMRFPLFKVGGGFGVGDKKHNTYLFGSNGVSGLSYHELKASLFIPFLPRKGIMIMNYSITKSSQSENRSSNFVREKDKLDNLSLLFIWPL